MGLADPKTKQQILALKRLVLAGVTFDHVILFCDHIESLGRNTFTPLHVPLFAGVSVTYMKPFMRSDGVRKVTGKFSEFPHAPGHAKTHKDLKNCRDWYYAHRDMINLRRFLPSRTGELVFEEVTLHLEASGISFSVHEQSWSFDSIRRVRNLCYYQKSQLDKEALGLVDTLRRDQVYSFGDYVLGRDFP
jgi:hypothetical protein